MANLAGKCGRCGNFADRRYPRAQRAWSGGQQATGVPTIWLCEHCADLDVEMGRAQYRDGHKRAGNPRSQPAKAGELTKRKPCVWCGAESSFLYRWLVGNVAACGWGHAGLWMDQQIEEDLTEGEAYVRRSLGIED